MLLNRFHRLFGHAESVVEHANWLTDRRQIVQILQGVQQERCLLEAKVDGHPDSFSTAIIGINPKTGIMALDELTPRKGHNLFLKHGAIHLSGRADGIDVEFDLELLAERVQAGIVYYQANIPKAVIYIQRRDIYRVPLSAATPFIGQLKLENEDEEPQILTGYASDVSPHGIGLVLDNVVTLQKGEELTACKIEITGHEPFFFGLEIRFAEQIQHRRSTHIGGRFLDIDKQERNRLKQIILQIERNHAAMGIR